MADYIDKQAFLDYMKRTDRYFNVKFDIENFPNADVAPVRHGQWELEYGTYGKMRCSVCKKEALIEKTIGDVGVITKYVDSNYCPNCGAKMDEKENEPWIYTQR